MIHRGVGQTEANKAEEEGGQKDLGHLGKAEESGFEVVTLSAGWVPIGSDKKPLWVSKQSFRPRN